VEWRQPVSAKGPEVERFKQSRAFRASFQGISKKGTYATDEREYTSANWALLPPPAVTDEIEGTILPLAQTFAIMARKRGGAPEDEAVKAMLGMREDLYQNWLGQYMYFYMGQPRYRPLPVMLGVWQIMGERSEQLRLLAGYNTVDLVEPPVLEEFSTEHLGTGIKVWCVQKAEKRRKAVVGLLGYAWRCAELETDLHLKTMCTDLGWLQAAMPGIEEFARAIRIVPKSDGG
jgi:hypothetical protein